MDLFRGPRRLETGTRPPGPRGPQGDHGDSEALVRAVRDFQAGVEREESFRLLFETYRSAVQGFFLRRLGSPEAAHDLTQETFLKVYKGLKGYRGDAPFGAWLFRIARSVLHGRYSGSAAARLRAREVQMEEVAMEVTKAQAERLAAEGGGEPLALASVLHEERRRALRRAVERLPPQRRRCIVLWAYYELTYEQIAVVMRLSVGTVKAHLAQAREQLGLLMDDGTEDVDT